VVLLLAFTHVTWPLPFGQYPNLAECERERAAIIRKFGDEMAAHGMTLACVEPGRQAQRGRFEFRASPL